VFGFVLELESLGFPRKVVFQVISQFRFHLVCSLALSYKMGRSGMGKSEEGAKPPFCFVSFPSLFPFLLLFLLFSLHTNCVAFGVSPFPAEWGQRGGRKDVSAKG
jgi:hypothetical protein